VNNFPTALDAVVVKLSGATGTELWRYTLDGGSDDLAFAVRLDPAGDVIAAATLGDPPSAASVSAIVKLAGATGNLLWRMDFADTYDASRGRGPGVGAIAVDDAGDVAAEGFTVADASPPLALIRTSVALLSGSDGSEIWRRDREQGLAVASKTIPRLAFGPSGTLITSDRQFAVAMLAPGDGHELWRATLGCEGNDTLEALTVDSAGDVAVAGTRADCMPEPLEDFTIAKLRGADGTEVWRRSYETGTIDTLQPRHFSANVLAATSTNDIVAAGSTVFAYGTGHPATFSTVLLFSGTTGALDVCGDSYVDPGEECDDGNTADGDCCSSACRAAPDGTSCFDGDHCTANDTCAHGACQPGPPLPCEPCGTCDPSQGCVQSLPFACLAPTATARSVISLDLPHPALAWEWESGAATTKADFGDPRTSTGYALCIYGDAPDGAPLVRATANAGKSCAKGKGCWKKTSKGFRYESQSKSPDGLSGITLQEGGAGKARIAVHGKGKKLVLPSLPVTAPVTVQLRKLDGSPPCWGAEYPTVIKNTAKHFVARGD
jgi:cysteine-rich repeat protein